MPTSRFAVPGLFFFDGDAAKLAHTLQPSARGELEITALNELYLRQGRLHVELMTRGSLVHKDGAYYIVYKETETTGYEGCTTPVKVAEDARKVSMLRFGKQSSQLIIEKGTRHLCHYETGYGSVSLGVAADVIEQRLDENGGSLKFSYTLDSGAESFISRNLVDITADKLPEA